MEIYYQHAATILLTHLSNLASILEFEYIFWQLKLPLEFKCNMRIHMNCHKQKATCILFQHNYRFFLLLLVMSTLQTLWQNVKTSDTHVWLGTLFVELYKQADWKQKRRQL